jgi:predicted nucleic acid-binding protein
LSAAFVLDCSVALAWCFEDEASPFADEVLDRLTSDTAIVPSVLWQLELCNGLVVAVRRGRLSEQRAREHLARYVKLRIVGARVPIGDVFSLAQKHQRTSYDAAYLALALRDRLPLATLDGGLRQGAREAGVPLLSDG